MTEFEKERDKKIEELHREYSERLVPQDSPMAMQARRDLYLNTKIADWVYGNYIKKLQAENETLKLEIENLNIKISDLEGWKQERL